MQHAYQCYLCKSLFEYSICSPERDWHRHTDTERENEGAIQVTELNSKLLITMFEYFSYSEK